MDTIRIETLPNGTRTGRLLSSEYENRLQSKYNSYEEYRQASLENRLYSKEVFLMEEALPADGDYNIDEFKEVDIAAPVVNPDDPTSMSSGKRCYKYVANEEPI